MREWSMAQEQQSKEMSGKKMVKFIMGTIIVASVLIVIGIQSFYMLYEPKERKQIEQDETEEPSYTKSAMHSQDQLLYLG